MKKIIAIFLSIFCCLCLFSGCKKEGLQYELHSSGEYYIVTGKTNNAGKNLVIASKYKDLPVREIGNNAFENWVELDSIKIPKTITRIGEKAFYGCKNLQNLHIEEGVEEIGIEAIGKGFLEIKEYAFSDCDSLSKVILPKSLKLIDKGVFFDCDSIVNIAISNNVDEIGIDAFSECDSLMAIMVDDMNAYFQSIDGVLYSKDGNVVIQYPPFRQHETYCIEFDVKEIKEKAFLNADFKVVDICGMFLEKIGAYAFKGCKKIETITISDTVNSIGIGCFLECENLQTVAFNDINGWMAVKKNAIDEIIDSKEFTSEELSNPISAKNLLQEYIEYQWTKN